MLHEGYPGLWNLDYAGFSDSPTARTVRNVRQPCHDWHRAFTRSFTIPTRAPAGYFYLLEVQHREGPLVLDAPFQVCTLKLEQDVGAEWRLDQAERRDPTRDTGAARRAR